LPRTLLAFGAALVVTACGDSPTAAGPAAVHPATAALRYEQSFRMFRTACNGELVTLAGMTTVTVTQQGNVLSAVLLSEGEGAGSRSHYRISWLRTLTFVDGETAHESTGELLRLMGDGKTPDTFIHGVTSVTRNADGTVLAEVDFDDEACHAL
jgi:hypothetical protein